MSEPRPVPELRSVAWRMQGVRPDAGLAYQIEQLVKEAYRRGRLDERNPGSRDNDGTDRRTYEPPNCRRGNVKHDQHFHSPIGSLPLNCPGSFGLGETEGPAS